MSELLDILIMLCAAGVLIAWFDFTLSNIPDTLARYPSRKSIHDRADEGSDADCYLIGLIGRAKKPATMNSDAGGDGSQERQRASRLTQLRDASSSSRPLGQSL